MTDEKRTDVASRVIRASPQVIYRALVEPEALVAWRPPKGMTGTIDAFDAREGGVFRMTLHYPAEQAGRGKTSARSDAFEGVFLALVPDECVVERITFDSDDPAFAGAMTVTTMLASVAGGTEVVIRCENVPSGISAGDHEIGMASTLANLAAFTER